jgi:hypothetical protein
MLPIIIILLIKKIRGEEVHDDLSSDDLALDIGNDNEITPFVSVDNNDENLTDTQNEIQVESSNQPSHKEHDENLIGKEKIE